MLLLGHACRQELAGKATTLEQDEATLSAAGDQVAWRLWNALQLRMGHKKLLQKGVDQADAAIMFLTVQRDAAMWESGQPKLPTPRLEPHSEL